MKPKTQERPVVQTVKIDSALYVKLKTYGARARRSNQDILHTALVEYLAKMKA
jgi:hypothetical protein